MPRLPGYGQDMSPSDHDSATFWQMANGFSSGGCGLLPCSCPFLGAGQDTAARLLSADSWTVAANFPWGVSLGLEFDTSLSDYQ
jgi:hypothetical protein